MKSDFAFIIKKPWISEKSTEMGAQGKYVFLVDPTAKSLQIKQAVQAIYKVHVTGVNIVRSKGMKKAIVTLKKGETIDIMPH